MIIKFDENYKSSKFVTILREALINDPKHGWLPVPLLILTLLAGIVDAVSILSLGHVFVANMTGNLVFIGFALSGAPGFSVPISLTALGGFTLGVLLCRVIATPKMNRISFLYRGSVLELTLIVAATGLSFLSDSQSVTEITYVLVAISAAALGIQNSFAKHLEIAELTTTVMTRTLIGLTGEFRIKRSRREVIRQASSVLALVGGAVFGAIVVQEFGRQSALASTSVLAAVVVGMARFASRNRCSWGMGS